MKLLSLIWKECLDFLFPRSATVVGLESLSTSKLLQTLPQAEQSKDENIILLFDYKDQFVRELVWELKYKGSKIVAEKLGEIIYDVLTHEIAERALFGKLTEVLLIPMPISDKRRNERGWNQTEILCDAIKSRDTENLFKYKPRQLVKHYHTESQTKTASKRERWENIKGSMKVLSPHVVDGKFIILVDDVYTTGSTYLEAKRALKAAGAKKILFIGVAH